MKKRYLIPLIILGMGAVGTAAGFSVSAYYQNKANETAQIIEKQEEIASDENLTEEEKSQLEAIITQLESKYNEIKDIQVAGTTIGAIAGSIVGALIGLIPALLNRANIKEAIGFTTFTRNLVDTNQKYLEEVKEKIEISNKKYDQTIEVMGSLKEQLEKTEKHLVLVEKQNEQLSIENGELKDIILTFVCNDKEAVASGVAELLSKKYLKK